MTWLGIVGVVLIVAGVVAQGARLDRAERRIARLERILMEHLANLCEEARKAWEGEATSE